MIRKDRDIFGHKFGGQTWRLHLLGAMEELVCRYCGKVLQGIEGESPRTATLCQPFPILLPGQPLRNPAKQGEWSRRSCAAKDENSGLFPCKNRCTLGGNGYICNVVQSLLPLVVKECFMGCASAFTNLFV